MRTYKRGGRTMTEILLLGTFHYMEENIDFYSEEIQKELQQFVHKLSLFKPDAIAIEAAIHQQKAIDESYVKFKLSDLLQRETMETKVLGTITMFGNEYPITYNNEAIQVGYRLGKMLNLDRVYAIDDDSLLDMSVFNNPTERLRESINHLNSDIEKHSNDSITDLYKYYNSREWSELNHQVYLDANSINSDGQYNGAMMVTKWYERNLKIFCNIQQLAKHNKRIFVIYGAGHLQVLRDLINASNDLELVDVYNYL